MKTLFSSNFIKTHTWPTNSHNPKGNTKVVPKEFIALLKTTLSRMCGAGVLDSTVVDLDFWRTWPKKYREAKRYIKDKHGELDDDDDEEEDESDDAFQQPRKKQNKRKSAAASAKIRKTAKTHHPSKYPAVVQVEKHPASSSSTSSSAGGGGSGHGLPAAAPAPAAAAAAAAAPAAVPPPDDDAAVPPPDDDAAVPPPDDDAAVADDDDEDAGPVLAAPVLAAPVLAAPASVGGAPTGNVGEKRVYRAVRQSTYKSSGKSGKSSSSTSSGPPPTADDNNDNNNDDHGTSVNHDKYGDVGDAGNIRTRHSIKKTLMTPPEINMVQDSGFLDDTMESGPLFLPPTPPLLPPPPPRQQQQPSPARIDLQSDSSQSSLLSQSILSRKVKF